MSYADTTEWHPVQLPSMGRHYGDLLPDGKVQITPWTVAQEELIARHSEGSAGDITDQLLQSNTRFPPGFGYGDLLTTDQFFLLLNLRIISFVDFMTLAYACPQCEAVEPLEVKLSDIVVRTAEPEDPDEPFPVFLPNKKVEVKLRFRRVKDLEAAASYVSKMPAATPEVRRKFLYARQIEFVDGNSLPFDERLAFVSTLNLLDLQAITRECERHSSGYRGTYPAVCEKCGASDTGWVPPIHEDFFRPKPTDIDRAVQLALQDRSGGE